jgi:nucleoid DNA-binding protein
MQKRTLKLVKDIAREMNIHEDVIKAVVESQFQCARDAIKEGDPENIDSFVNVRFRNLGLLVASKYKIIAVRDKIEERKQLNNL